MADPQKYRDEADRLRKEAVTVPKYLLVARTTRSHQAAGRLSKYNSLQLTRIMW
jgi:hypothetical protein